MLRLISSILAIAIAVGIAATAAYVFTMKARYETAAKEVNDGLLEPHPLTSETQALIETIETEWSRTEEEPSTIEADALANVQYPASIEGLKQLYCVPAPGYSLVDLSGNHQSSMILITQAILIPTSVDGKFHCDADKAVIFINDLAAQIYREQDGRLETSAYLKTDRPLP